MCVSWFCKNCVCVWYSMADCSFIYSALKVSKSRIIDAHKKHNAKSVLCLVLVQVASHKE